MTRRLLQIFSSHIEKISDAMTASSHFFRFTFNSQNGAVQMLFGELYFLEQVEKGGGMNAL